MAEVGRRGAIILGGLLMAGDAAAASASLYDFRMEAIEGGPLALSDYRGKAVLVVNTASFCGYTPQYAGLQKLHETYGPRGLVVLGVPSQDFNQESSDNKKIKDFCEANYNVEIPDDDGLTCPRRAGGAGLRLPGGARRRPAALELPQVPGRPGRPHGARLRHADRAGVARTGPGDRSGAGQARDLMLRAWPYPAAGGRASLTAA
ncbi:redoxin domain-containing protein [Dankookia sp. P2]|uniref:redoxin domain-containing protein n=1 Tax=Dankookia sp. P2 TaxID=3423955 RepID=UPI003D67CCAF